MRFNILGSIEVIDGARRVALGGFKQRAALAALVLQANRVVTADSLIDQLWGEQPPRQAHNVLHTYISTLRRALEPERAAREPARVLRSQSPGYMLAVGPDDVDAAHFERLTAEGHALLQEDRPDAAADVLRTALGLWRGPALVEFAGEPFARPEAARLEDLRLAALEDRIAADLAAGRHAAVIGELQRLVETEPMREALWTSLVLALYRAGRQADALAAYQRCRRTLDHELGIEPGPALRQLEVDILRQAPSLDWSTTNVGTGAAGNVRIGSAGDAKPPHPPAPEEGVPFLMYRDGSGRERVHALEQDDAPITVGRGPSARLSLPWDDLVSRTHAVLEWRGDTWALVDDELSRNGTFVNGERVRRDRPLSDGDVLRFGDTTMTFRHPKEPVVPETRLA